MALITRRWPGTGKVLLIILVTVVFVFLYYFSSRQESQNDAFEKLSELPAPFVRTCQKSAEQFTLPWELLAASFQVRLEHRLIDSYPDAAEIVKTAARLAQSKGVKRSDIVNGLGYSRQLAGEITARAKILQSKSFLLSRGYVFPYKIPLRYTDTWGADREGGKRKHEGTDIFADEGTPIFSVSDGKVEKLGWNRLGGERVGVRGRDGIYYYYAHLSRINPELKVGIAVTVGSLLGFTGHTGDAISTPDHLHFGMELPNGSWINPYNLLRYWENNNPNQNE